MAILAAAQQKVVTVAGIVAKAKEAEAASVAAANEKEVVSENFLVAGFQRAAAQIGEAAEGIRDRMVVTSEGVGLRRGISRPRFPEWGNCSLQALSLGASSIFADKASKTGTELYDLSVSSGLAVQALAGLKEMAKGMNLDWEPIYGRTFTSSTRSIRQKSMRSNMYARCRQLVSPIKIWTASRPLSRWIS